ncbi:hypothetical protein DPV78_003136 [Talaromyces pinophilus]|nr:hypothetical protein DPV78_003136 [Talaromyces pinophilus]
MQYTTAAVGSQYKADYLPWKLIPWRINDASPGDSDSSKIAIPLNAYKMIRELPDSFLHWINIKWGFTWLRNLLFSARLRLKKYSKPDNAYYQHLTPTDIWTSPVLHKVHGNYDSSIIAYEQLLLAFAISLHQD